MKVSRHRIREVEGGEPPFVASPNQGGDLDPRYIVIHYTAGPDARTSVDWLANPGARASAHVVVARDGTLTQLVPFNRVAWHAGVSRWDGLDGMNNHSIGIELDNAGRLEHKGGRWCAWFGTHYSEEELMLAAHRHETRPCGWHLYSPEQIASTLRLCEVLVEKYPIRDVVGHDDISPGRKSDPGPAFPMMSFRSHLFGRAEDHAPLFRTRAALNIRVGPGTLHDQLPGSPLPQGTRLEVMEEKGEWRFVNVLDRDETKPDVMGWVHGGYIERVVD